MKLRTRLLHVFDNLTATDEERRLGREWADYARHRFGGAATAKLSEGLRQARRIKSRKAMRIAIRRAEARLRDTIVVTTLR